MREVYTVCYCLCLTLIIETPVVFLLTRELHFVSYSIWCNILTNPLLNTAGLILMHFFGYPVYVCYAAVGEIAVLFIEMRLYYFFDRHNTPLRRCFLISLICNAASFLIGLGISLLFRV